MKKLLKSFSQYSLVSIWSIVVALTLVPISTAQAQKSLSPEDMAEIHNLYAHYNLVLDAGDSMSWADTFTDDGSFNNSVGRQALITFANNWAASNPNTRHWNSNIHITATATATATADGAAGTAYLMLWKISVQAPEIVLTGTYSDQLVKTPNGWKFKARRVKIDR